MARQRKAETEAALQGAQTLFWEHGYAGIGTRQIEERTGLTRFMLQTAHGGKKKLFLQVINNYLDYVETSFLPAVNLGSFEELARWFESRVDPDVMPDSFCHGCLMLNSIIEFHGADLEFNQKTDRFLPMTRDRFRTILETANNNSTSRSDFIVADKVELLLGMMLSMAVVIRAGGSVVAAKPLAKAAAAMIRGWDNH